MSNQIVISSGAKVRNLSGVLTGTAGVVNSVPLGGANGVATLDALGKVPLSQLPASVVTYLGTWNASTNTPTLVNGTGDVGDLYICNVAGTVNFGAGPITFAAGDWVIYSGTTWQKSSGATGTVTSVAVTESGDALTITGSPITTSGTINIGFAGTSGQYVNGAGGLTTFPSLTGFVPYTGATTNVNLGEFGLTSGYLGLDITPTSTPTAQGTMYWNADKESVDVIMNGVTGSVMQDTFFNVKNQTGASIPKGTVVRANGTLGASGRILIAPFLADGTYDSKVCLGVTAETIANGEDGKVTAFGAIRQIDTSAFPNGTILYASPSVAGAFTSTEPTNPNNIVTVAIVIYSDNTNGEVFVRPTFVDNATDIAAALGYTPLSGTGTTNYIPKFTGTTSIGNSSIQELASGLVSISGTTLGELDLIGTSQATLFLGHNSTIDNVIQSSSSSSFNILNTIGASQTYLMYYDYTSKALSFQTNGFNTRLLIDSSGNIGINTASPSYKLDINGTARVSGQLTLGSTITNGTYTYTLPSATGTLALTSDLSGYLPLSGGTLSGALTIGVAAGIGLDVASDLVIFRASTGFGSPRQITLAAGNGPTTYLEAKGYGANYITDFGIRTYNASGTAFEVFFATSAGNVGIGNTAPAAKLDVNGTGKFTSNVRSNSYFQSNDGTRDMYFNPAADFGAGGLPTIQVASNHALQFATNNSLRLTITSGGNVGIGITAPTQPLHVYTSATTTSSYFETNNVNSYIGLKSTSGVCFIGNVSHALSFEAGGSERMRITSGGNVGIGASNAASSAVRLVVQGADTSSSNWSLIATDSGGGTIIGARNDRAIFAPGVFSFTTGSGANVVVFSDGSMQRSTSSLKYKKNVENYTKGLAEVMQMRPVTYNSKNEKETQTFAGLIAEEVHELGLTEFVQYAEDGSPDALSYSNMVALLIKSIQELKAEIDELKNK